MRYGTIEIHPAHTGHNSQPNPQRRNVITLVNWASYNGDGTSTPKDAPNESPTAPPKNPQSIRSKEVREEKPKRASRAGVDPTAAIIPDNLKGSEQAIRAWLNYKREKGQGYQPEGLRAFFSKLSKLPDVPAAIEHSMASNYTGVYPPSGNGHSKIPMKVSPAYVGEDARYE
ncbi:MAG: hypothetical protein IT461_13130 [Planctomycetes bacterium]|nr:hypothetical protein [Planctomycetota bacterium]